MRLTKNFFNRNTVRVAQDLLGKYLVRRINGKIIKAMITETEAYCGQKDKACHAYKGLTKRTEVMFGPPGRAYVYMIYGMHHCLNVVTREAGCPEAVLIRAANAPGSILDGPGKLCRELKIDKQFNGIDLCKSKELWIESPTGRKKENQPRIKRGKRIGIDYAGAWKDKLWRFYL